MREAIVDDKKTLTHKQLRWFSKYLPEPFLTCQYGDIAYSVYRVKRLFIPKWSDPILKRLLVEARKTYKAYGSDIPEIDSYDLKSAIYLVKASYTVSLPSNQKIPMEEWLSVRFVPGAGQPLSNEDLDFYVYKDTQGKIPILDFMRWRLPTLQKLTEEEALLRIATISRLCVIRPYTVNEKDRNLFRKHQRDHKNLGRNNHIAASFALANKVFLENIQSMRIPVEILTCQMHKVFSDKILSFPFYSGKKTLPFSDAYTQLRCKDKESICLDREKDTVYAYKYPGYFLHLRTLAQAFNYVVTKGLLSKNVIEKHLVSGISYEQFLIKPDITHLGKMGKLFTKKGKIPRSKLTGSQLRTHLSMRVKDGAVFRIMYTKEWSDGIEDLLENINRHYRLGSPYQSKEQTN